MVARLERYAPLERADREALLSLPHQVRSIPAGAHIIRDGDPARYCSLLLSGFAYRYKLTGQGGRQIISLHMAGEYLDLQNSLLGVADHSVQTLTDAEVAMIPPSAIEALTASHPAVARVLWMDTLVDASIF